MAIHNFNRMGVSLIMTHKQRFIQDSDTVCPMCMEEEEDEIHFILHCPVFHDLRQKYLAPFDSPPNLNRPTFNCCYVVWMKV